MELVIDRIFAAIDPAEERPNPKYRTCDRLDYDYLVHMGMNTSRGSLIALLGDFLSRDDYGTRAAVVVPYLLKFAGESNLGVRSCVADVISLCLSHDRDSAYKAFAELIDCDDILFSSRTVQSLIVRIGSSNLEKVVPVIKRMLNSSVSEARVAGGSLAALAGLSWGYPQLLEDAFGGDVDIRTGIAIVCSDLVSEAKDSDLEFQTLCRLIDDDDDEVRKTASRFVGHLVGENISQFRELLVLFIKSLGFEHSILQIFRILRNSLDEDIELVIIAASRYLDVRRASIGRNALRDVNEARDISTLVVRALSRASGVDDISKLLDILDRLVEYGAYGINEKIEGVRRV